MVRAGRFAWIGGGRHRTSTTHVDNTVEGLVLAPQRGRPGNVYFVTDGEPVVFREFVTRAAASAGREPPIAQRPRARSRARWRAAARLRGAASRSPAARR